MARTESTMLALGTEAPEFFPRGRRERAKGLAPEAAGRPLLVMFICRHCPYVKHLEEELAHLGRDYQGREVSLVAISSNDVATHPDDHPDRLREQAQTVGFTFPYLYDDSQSVAAAFSAACTPDFFLFDRQHHLVYRGQLDSSRPGNGQPVTGRDLRTALDQVLSGGPVTVSQVPSLGCNIKWKPR